MEAPRYLCSQLVTLSWNDGAVIVNLEEIRTEGAVLESEVEVPLNSAVEIRCGSVFFAGTLTHSEAHDSGFRISVEFSPLTLWSIERFRPEHLLDLSELGKRPSGIP
jgi:hypothetical protein